MKTGQRCLAMLWPCRRPPAMARQICGRNALLWSKHAKLQYFSRDRMASKRCFVQPGIRKEKLSAGITANSERTTPFGFAPIGIVALSNARRKAPEEPGCQSQHDKA